MPFGLQFDPYQVLGLRPGASQEEIREAYYRVAKKHHPDTGGDDWAFRVVSRAHEIVTAERNVCVETLPKAESARASGRPDLSASAVGNPNGTEPVSPSQFDWSVFKPEPER